MGDMLYDTKTAIILRSGLASWQLANVTAFLSGGLAAKFPYIIGEAYKDGSNQPYLPLLREPVFVYGADEAGMKRTHQRALSRGLDVAIYTSGMFATSNDADNRAGVASFTTDELDLVGIAIHADRKITDKIINGLKFLA